MHRETEAQLALMQWARYVRVGAYWLSELLAHVPNGGKRGKIEAAIFKGMGVQKGWPDLQLMIPVRDFHAAFWELKDRGETPDANQIRWHEILRHFGYYVAWFDDWERCSQDVLRYLALPGAPKNVFGLSILQPAMIAAKRALPYRPSPRQRRSR